MRRLKVALGVVLAAALLAGLSAAGAQADVPGASPSPSGEVVTHKAAAPAVHLKGATAVKTGSRLRLSGTVRHARAAAKTVVIYQKAGARWVRVKSVTLTPDHRFTTEVRFTRAGAHPLRAQYRAGGFTARSAVLVVHVTADDPPAR